MLSGSLILAHGLIVVTRDWLLAPPTINLILPPLPLFLFSLSLIVGAPNGTHSNSEVRNTGFVYECRITGNGKCTRITHLSDDSGNSYSDSTCVLAFM